LGTMLNVVLEKNNEENPQSVCVHEYRQSQ